MSLSRDISTVSAGTVISRLLAYLRDAWIAALLGAGPYSEAFFVIFQLFNFFRRLVTEGAVNASFVPIWLRLRESANGAPAANLFTRRILLTLFCTVGIFVLLTVFLGRFVVAIVAPGFDDPQRSLATLLLIIVAPYILFGALVAVITAALSAESRVLAVAVSTVLFNLVMLLALLFVALAQSDHFFVATALGLAVSAAGLIQFAVAFALWLATGRRWQRAHLPLANQASEFFARVLPGLIATGIPQFKLIAGAAIASSSSAAVSWLYYANRLYELPLGIASIAVGTVIVPRLVRRLGEDQQAFVDDQSRAYEIAFGLALPAATGFALLAKPIASALFERGAFGPGDSTAVAAALIAICIGLPAHILEKVFGAVAFAYRDTRTPMLVGVAGFAAAVAGGLLLFPVFGHVGVAASIAASAWVDFALLSTILYRRSWLRVDGHAVGRLARIIAATGTMACILIAATHALGDAIHGSSVTALALLLALVGLGAVSYFGSLHLLGVMTVKNLFLALRLKS
ncbi:MAG TPA: murein biosynthesis integral membrane protein MurJ [Pseudolabrys sp.]|nr:murein biosynthesis integral membrane protein MurJ [Pseudolabrys sp.]